MNLKKNKLKLYSNLIVIPKTPFSLQKTYIQNEKIFFIGKYIKKYKIFSLKRNIKK